MGWLKFLMKQNYWSGTFPSVHKKEKIINVVPSNLSLPLCTCPKTLLVVQMCTHCEIVAKSTDASFGDDTDISAVAKQRYKPRVLTAVSILRGLGASSCKWHWTMSCYVSICLMFSLTPATLVHMVLSHRYRQQGEGARSFIQPSSVQRKSVCFQTNIS